MEASKNQDEILLLLSLADDDDQRRHDLQRRRRRLPRGPAGCCPVVFAIGFVLILSCAACLTITLHSAAQVSELKGRLKSLEKERLTELDSDEWPPAASPDQVQENFYNLEEAKENSLKTVDHIFKHRLRREVSEKKRPKQQPKGNKKIDSGKISKSSAIHLNLNVREATTAELQMFENGDVITLPYGELSKLGFRPKKEYYNGEHAYIYKAWKVADWAQGEKEYHFDLNKGTVQVTRKGLYFIYSQILYHNSAARSSYVIMIDKDPFIKCMESVDAVMPDSQTSADSARYKTCYVGAARILDKGQNVWIKDLYSRFVTTDPTANFFGLIKLTDLEK